MVQSFGKVTVTTGGTPVRATSLTGPGPGGRVGVQSFLIQALPANTGLIYVLREEKLDADATFVGDNRSSLAKVIGIIGAPTSATAHPPALSVSIPNAVDGEDLRKIWLDAGVSGEGALLSATHSQGAPYA